MDGDDASSYHRRTEPADSMRNKFLLISGTLLAAFALLGGEPARSSSDEPPAQHLLHVKVVNELPDGAAVQGEVVAREETRQAAELHAPFVISSEPASAEVTMPLPPMGSWWFRVTGKGLFARPRLAAFPLESRTLTLGFRPLVRVVGRFVVPAGTSIEGGEALVRWRAPGGLGHWEAARSLVANGQVETEVPAGTWDLAVKVTGCASDRREGTVMPPGATTDLGTISAAPGASLVGRVTIRDREAGSLPKDVRITLSPPGEIPDPSARGEGIVLGRELRPSPSGEFQFKSLVAGRYDLRVFATGFAREDRVVDLVPDMEVEFDDPIALSKPASLQIDLSPQLDPKGQAWRVELQEKGEAGWLPGSALTARSSAGTAVFGGVRLKGEYVAIVRAGSGDAWRVQAVTIDSPRTRLSLRLDQVPVSGRLTLGGEPLTADLVYGGRNTTPSVRTKSGDDGEYLAELPHAGPWRVAVVSETPRISRDVKVEVPEAKDGFPARVDIDLPATRLKVRVADSRGAPWKASCLVRLESVLTHEDQSLHTVTGEVETVGLESGEWIVFAESARAVSERKTVTLETDGSHEVALTLSEKKLVQGVVVSDLGVPVPYALLQPLRWDSRADTFPPAAKADALGRFQLQVPPEVDRVGFLVVAPGHAVMTAVVPVSESVVQAVQVSREGGRVVLSFDSGAFPPPRMPWISDGILTFNGVLLRSRSESRINHGSGRTVVEIPSYRPGPISLCMSARTGSSDLESVGQDCVFGHVAPASEVILDLGKPK